MVLGIRVKGLASVPVSMVVRGGMLLEELLQVELLFFSRCVVAKEVEEANYCLGMPHCRVSHVQLNL